MYKSSILLFLYLLSPCLSFRTRFAELVPRDALHGFTPAPNVPKKNDPACKNHGKCVPPVQCPVHFKEDLDSCHIPGGRSGVCCNTGQNFTAPHNTKARSSNIVTLPLDMLVSVAKTSREEVRDLMQKESTKVASGRAAGISEGSPYYTHFRQMRFSDPNSMHLAMGVNQRALEMVAASRSIKNKKRFSSEQFEWGMIHAPMADSALGIGCSSTLCPKHLGRYQSLDGTCNNPHRNGWGSIMTPFARLLPPSYDDGIWAPRVSVSHGQPLPSPRLISSSLVYDKDRPDDEHTLMLMTFGQFISHDITRSMDHKLPNGDGISCCSENGHHEISTDSRHFACMPIHVSKKDPFYKYFEQGCINFVRSLLAPRDDCSLGYAEQMNKVTHFLDGSAIYGTTHTKLDELREFSGGRLKIFNDFGRDLLPLSKNQDDCLTMEHGSACFASGDSRTNQMIGLVAVHLLFVREHNRIAEELQKLNPHWDDEVLFLEARRIVIAEMNHIIYSQWLPEIIGHSAMHEFELDVDQDGYSMDYDPEVNPSITNEFTAAAFRFGHSIVDGKLKIYGPEKMEEIIDIPDVMFAPARMRKREFFDELLATLTSDCIQKADRHFPDALTKYMFRAGNPFGLDLVSFNIQRGRDHGLRPYNDYRKLVGLHKIETFEEFGHEAGAILAQLYESVDDVDLYVGALLEDHAPGAIVGYTFRDMIADQFYRLKKGDKYFYDLHPNINPGHFTPEQLKEIKKSSFSRIICDNRDDIMISKQSLNPFRKPGYHGNEVVDCNSHHIKRINLKHWQEN